MPAIPLSADGDEQRAEARYLADAIPLGLSLALVTTSLLMLNPHDPLPRELVESFGFDAIEQQRCRAVRTVSQLLDELKNNLPAMHCYLLVARYALECPPIWTVVAASLQATDEEEDLAPESLALERKYHQYYECMGAGVQLARRLTSTADDLAEELRLQDLALQGLFARLGATVRPGIAARPEPDTEPPAPVSTVSPHLAQLLLLAVSLIEHLPHISDHPLVRGLTSLSFVQASVRLPLYKRLIELPAGAGISLSEAELLTLYQAAQVALLAQVVDITPEGTWADWVQSRILAPDPPQPFVPTYDQDQLDQVNTTAPADLRAYSQLVQDHFDPGHPLLDQAVTEIRQLAELL
ncbi:hypothetical protein [Hymenobacter algoricola]|uniref:Uncharacterized protein n=1 Tax=Hymenobacter algoricola TaxID=486267 RepID=A0ABP7MFF1_9BACT